MRKLTGGLIAISFLLCAFTAQAASNIDVSVPSAGEACLGSSDCASGEDCITNICIPSAGEPCSNDLDCTLGGSCVADICVPSVGDPCTNDLDCGPDGACINDICVPSAAQACTNDLQCSPGELCIDEICQEVECEVNADCDAGLICDNSSNTCVECLIDANCEEGDFCLDNTCVQGGDCDLTIKPHRININKGKNPDVVYKLIKIKGNENFDANGEPVQLETPSFSLTENSFLPWDYEIKSKRNTMRLVVRATRDLEPGFYWIRIGDCYGEVELYDKNAEKAAKKAAKAAAKAAKKAAKIDN